MLHNKYSTLYLWLWERCHSIFFTVVYEQKTMQSVWGLFKTRLSISSCACVEYWSAECCLVNEQHWWFHESVSLERANRFAAASKGWKNMRKAYECMSGHVRTQPVLSLTTSGYTECTDVRAIKLKSHPVDSWVEDKLFHQRNICLTWVLSRLLLFCLGFSSCWCRFSASMEGGMAVMFD